MPHIHYINHVPFENPAYIQKWAGEKGFSQTTTNAFSGGYYPEAAEFDWLVVMGGPMGVHDEAHYKWLKPEKALIKQAIKAGKVVIGVCLGAQLIAEALGARVYKAAYKEIGWYPVNLTSAGSKHPLTADLPGEFTAFHWHGDVFELPLDAVRLVESERTPNQAFVFAGRVVGLQFHMEMRAHEINLLIDNSLEELIDAPYIQSPEAMRSGFAHISPMNGYMHRLLDRLYAAEKTQGF